MNSYCFKQEFENICFRASVSIGSYDDVHNWLLQHNTNHNILSSEDVIILVLKYKAPLYIIKTLLNVLPNPGKIIGDNGQYLLHMACSFGASIEVVQILYDTNPTIISTSDDYGNLPLHLACKTNSSSQVIDFLIEKYTVALQIQNSHYHTPLHLACSNKDSSVDTIRKLITMYPKATKSGDINGELPIHHECSKENIILENLSALLDANPNSIWAENIYGITPSYNCNSNDENKFHHIIKQCIVQGLSVNLIKLLSKNFMSTAGSWCDEDGNCLLHHECMKTRMDISPDTSYVQQHRRTSDTFSK
jgi:ankyrin repeat protein